jgi:hypothetical protein
MRRLPAGFLPHHLVAVPEFGIRSRIISYRLQHGRLLQRAALNGKTPPSGFKKEFL